MTRSLRLLRDNALGLIAITIALSAGAYAVDKAPKNSVASSSIRTGAVKGIDVKDDSLTGEDINESTLALPSDAGGTVRSVTAGSGLSGGTITNAGTISFATCPANQVLKSTGPDYACAADADTNTTYTAGTGLQLSSTQFSIAANGVGSAQIADGQVGTAEIADDSITAADLGFVKAVGFAGGQIANASCSSATLSQTAQFAPGAPGDFTLVTSDPAMPARVVLYGQVGPVNAGFREYYLSACNLTGSAVVLPAATVKMLVISQ